VRIQYADPYLRLIGSGSPTFQLSQRLTTNFCSISWADRSKFFLRMKGKIKGLSAVVLALNHKNKGNGTTTTELLLLERELKYDCEDCCTVAKTSLELMRSREGEADSDTGGARVRRQFKDRILQCCGSGSGIRDPGSRIRCFFDPFRLVSD
jgi:hypothetical protein